MARKWKDDEIEKYIQSKQISQENYIAPTVKIGTIDTSSSNKKKYTAKKIYDNPIGPNKNDVRTITTPSTISDFKSIKDEKEKNLNIKQKEYEKGLSKTLNKSGTDFKVEFKSKQGQKLEYQNKEKDKEGQVAKPKINLSIPKANKQIQKQVDERNVAYNDYKIAKAQYDEAKVNSEKTTLADKTIMTPVRAIADLGSTIVGAGEDSYIKDEKGNKTFLPNYNELKQQKVRQDTKSTLGGIAQDAVYNGTKILGAGALDAMTGGIGGKALYWTDMSTDNYKNVKNQGYTGNQAIANTLISTGSEFVTEKLLGGVAGKVVGKSSPVQNILSDTVNKVLKKPVISNIIGSMGSEGLEEFTQEFIGAINDKLTLNKDANLADVFKDALYSAAVGATSAGITTGISNAEGKITQRNTNELNNIIKQLETERANTTNENTKNKINQTINTAQEYIDKPFTTNPVETFNNVNNNLIDLDNKKRNDVQGLQLPNEAISNNVNIPKNNENVNNQAIQNNVINDYNNQIKQEVENNDIANSSDAFNLGKNIDNKKEMDYNSQNGKGDYYEQSFKSGNPNADQRNGARRFGTEENKFNNEFVRTGNGETNEKSVARVDDKSSIQKSENRPRTYELRENNNGQQQTKTVSFTKDKINKLVDNYSDSKPTFVAKISPRDFLDMTVNEKTLGNFQKELKNNNNSNLDIDKLNSTNDNMSLVVDFQSGEIKEHDGRHRALNMLNSGVKLADITIYPASGTYNNSDIRNRDVFQLKPQKDISNSNNKVNASDVILANKENLENIYKKYSNNNVQELDNSSFSNEKVNENSSLTDIRNYEDMGNKKINAYQYDNPEVKTYFQQEANILLGELKDSQKAERYTDADGNFNGISRQVSEDIAELLDGVDGKYRLSYNDIEKGLKAIIEDHGAENIAAAKRIEFYLDKRLRNGYTTIDGTKIPVNQDYLNTISGKVNNVSNNELPFELDEKKSDNEVLKIDENGNSDMLSDKPKILDKVPKKKEKVSLREEWQWAKRKFVDKGEAIYRISKQTKNNTLYHKYDRMGTSTGEAQNQIGTAQTDLIGKQYNNFTDNKGNNTSMSVEAIWKDANNSGISDKVLNEYLINYLNLDRLEQGKEQFGSLTAYESQDTINKLEKEYPEIRRVANNVWQYNKNQLQKLVDAGLVSKESQKYYNDNTPHYVRIQRNVNKSSNPIFDNQGHLKVNNQIQTVKGGTNDILPLKETMAQQTVDTTSAIRRNLFGQELLKTLGNGQESDLVAIDNDLNINPDILSDDGKGNYTFTIYKDGKAVTIPIDKGIYEAVKPNEHYEWENKLPARVARSMSSVQRALLTDKNPLFMATNFFKDFGDAPLNSKYGTAKFVTHYGEAMADAFAIGKQKGKYSRLYEALGGNQNSYFNQGEFTEKGKVGKTVDFLMTPIEAGNEYIERLPRLAEFITTIKENGYEVNSEGDLVPAKGKRTSKSVDEVLNEAMYNSAEITTNFKRGGNYTKAANRNGFTFLNASVQGFDKQIRNFTEIRNPKQAVRLISKALILGVGAGLLNDGMYGDDDEYKDLPDYVKDNYYLFKGKNDKWIRIPKGRAISIIQSAARRTKNLANGDKDAFKGFGELIGNQIAPNNPFENNIVSPFVSVKSNKSWSGNKIVSDAIANESHPEEEYDAKTDEFSKWIGKKMHLSPKKINYIIDQYTGVIGDLGLPALSKYAENEKDDALSRTITNPIQDKFTTDSTLNNKNYSLFQEAFNKAENNKKWSKGTDNDKVKYSYLNSKNLEISEYYKQMRKIQESNKSDKTKFKEAKAIQAKINKTAKEAVEKSKTIKGDNNYKEIDGNYYYKYYNKDGTYSWRKDSSDSIPNERYYLAEYYEEKVAARKKRAKED